MDKLKNILDSKIEELKLLSEQAFEFSKAFTELGEELIDEKTKNQSFNENEMNLLYNIGVLNNVLKNKTVSIIELKNLVAELGEEYDFTELFKIPNYLQFELTYKEYSENQKFFTVSNGKVVRNEDLTEKTFDLFKNQIYSNLEGE